MAAVPTKGEPQLIRRFESQTISTDTGDRRYFYAILTEMVSWEARCSSSRLFYYSRGTRTVPKGVESQLAARGDLISVSL